MNAKKTYHLLRALNVLLASGVVLYGSYFLIVGRRFSGIAVSQNFGGLEVRTLTAWYLPDPTAVLYVLSASIIIFAQVKNWSALSWLGLLALAISSGLLLFSTGSPMLFVVLTLIITHTGLALLSARKLPGLVEK
jgi:hypothetical protein